MLGSRELKHTGEMWKIRSIKKASVSRYPLRIDRKSCTGKRNIKALKRHPL